MVGAILLHPANDRLVSPGSQSTDLRLLSSYPWHQLQLQLWKPLGWVVEEEIGKYGCPKLFGFFSGRWEITLLLGRLLANSREIKSSHSDRQGLMSSHPEWPLCLLWLLPSLSCIHTSLLADPQSLCTSAWNALLPCCHKTCFLTSCRVLLNRHLDRDDFPDYHLALVTPGIAPLLYFSWQHLSLVYSVYLFVCCLPPTIRMWAPWQQYFMKLKLIAQSLA